MKNLNQLLVIELGKLETIKTEGGFPESEWMHEFLGFFGICLDGEKHIGE